jgi:hypothetical protein
MGIVLILASVAAAAVLWLLFRPRKKGPAAPLADGDFEDLNEKFLRNPGGKQGTVELVRVYRPDDLELLRSLFDAEGIESYVPSANIAQIYPLPSIPGFSDSVVTVYAADQESARQIVADYPGAGQPKPELLG